MTNSVSPQLSTISSLHNIYYMLIPEPEPFVRWLDNVASMASELKVTDFAFSCPQAFGSAFASISPSRTRASPATVPFESAPSTVQIDLALAESPPFR